MCLILFGYQSARDYDLVLAANRDEFYSRATAPMHFWDAPVQCLAGKDLEQGGTWFGITRQGRFAALTNFRDPSSIRPDAPSRGKIITDFLGSDLPPETYTRTLEASASEYNGHNLLFGTAKQLYWFSNVTGDSKRIEPGIHGLSNRFLDTPWPKVETGRQALGKILDNPNKDLKDQLLEMLLNRVQPDDDRLPATGIGLAWERILSPMFIESESYGTRSSMVLMIRKDGRVEITERTYEPRNPARFEDRSFTFQTG